MHKNIKTLIDHQAWRRGGDGCMVDVTELGIALDWAIKKLKESEKAKKAIPAAPHKPKR